MIVLDASVLIGHFEPADPHHAYATALLKAHVSDSFTSSVITLAEVYAGAARVGQADRLHQLLTQLQIDSSIFPRRASAWGARAQQARMRCCVLYSKQQAGMIEKVVRGWEWK